MSAFMPNNYDPGHHHSAGNFALNHFEVYSDRHERVARVIDGLQSASGELQYLVVEFIAWEPGKQLLIPVHLAQVDLPTQRLYVPSLNRQQVLATPAYNRNPAVSSTPGQTVQQNVTQMRSLEQSAPLESSAPLEGYGVAHTPIPPIQPTPAPSVSPVVPRPTPRPIPSEVVTPRAHRPVSNIPPTQPPPELLQTSPTQPPIEYAQDHHIVGQEEVIPLREERLVVDQKKQKVGEVVVRKEIETEIIQVPVQREKLIVEQVGAEPKQLAEIDLTEEDPLTHPQHREAQLPPLPRRYE